MPHAHALSQLYPGDPALLYAPRAKLHRGARLLRVLAIATTSSWPPALLVSLNTTFPGRSHHITWITLPALDALRCVRLPPRLLAAADILLLEPGVTSTAPYAHDMATVESFLRTSLPMMPHPSALMLHSTMQTAEVGDRGGRTGPPPRVTETAVLQSARHPLLLLSQFYGLPSLWLRWQAGQASGSAHAPASHYRNRAKDGDGIALPAFAATHTDLAIATAQLLERAHVDESSEDMALSGSGSEVGVASARWQMPARRLLWVEEDVFDSGGRGSGGVDARSECDGPTRRAIQCKTLSIGPSGGAGLPAGMRECRDAVVRMPASRARAPFELPKRSLPVQSTECQLASQRPATEAAPLPTQCSEWMQANASAEALLPRGLLQRTRASVGSAGVWSVAWARVLARLEAGQTVSVCVLGGSMSVPRPLAADGSGGWPERLVAWMRERWPRAKVSLHNGAIGATGSTFFALCAETRLPKHVDLLVLECAAPRLPFVRHCVRVLAALAACVRLFSQPCAPACVHVRLRVSGCVWVRLRAPACACVRLRAPECACVSLCLRTRCAVQQRALRDLVARLHL